MKRLRHVYVWNGEQDRMVHVYDDGVLREHMGVTKSSRDRLAILTSDGARWRHSLICGADGTYSAIHEKRVKKSVPVAGMFADLRLSLIEVTAQLGVAHMFDKSCSGHHAPSCDACQAVTYARKLIKSTPEKVEVMV